MKEARVVKGDLITQYKISVFD